MCAVPASRNACAHPARIVPQDKVERLEFDRSALQLRLRDQKEAAGKDIADLNKRIEEIRVKYAKPPESEKMLDALSKKVLGLFSPLPVHAELRATTA